MLDIQFKLFKSQPQAPIPGYHSKVFSTIQEKTMPVAKPSSFLAVTFAPSLGHDHCPL